MRTAQPVTVEFHAWLLKHKSGSAVRIYTANAEEFIYHFGSPEGATKSILSQWRKWLEREEAQLSASSVNLKIDSVRCFFDFLIKHGYYEGENPALELKKVRRPKRKPYALELATVDNIREAIDAGGDLMDRAIFECLYGSLLRRTEAALLQFGHIDPWRHQVTVVGSDGKAKRTIMTLPQYDALKAWCLHRFADRECLALIAVQGEDAAFKDLLRRQPAQYIFVASDGRPMAGLADPGDAIYRRFKRYTSARPQQMRDTAATGMRAAGADIAEIKEALRHADMSTSLVYAQALNPTDEVYRSIQIKHPGNRKG
jgi:site-specific recombinase XerD